MSLEQFFSDPANAAEKQTLPVLRALTERYADEKPFAGLKVALGYLLVRNSMIVFEAVWRGGAEIVIADAFASPATAPVLADLARYDVPVYSIAEAVKQTDLYMDINCTLGRVKAPRAAVEITRTGVHHYEHIACPVVSADNCRAKKIEGFFGTGDGFRRAWEQLRPGDPLAGKRSVQFGYGKIGRGVAFQTRKAGMQISVVDPSLEARAKAEDDGFAALDFAAAPALEQALSRADVVISVTGIPDIHSVSEVPAAWFRANQSVLVNLGAQDEFGPEFYDEEILGGRAIPLNFHLAQPTLNRYVDPPLAAHVLALEALVGGLPGLENGVHPLPLEMDAWLLQTWRASWPDEDLTGIGEELGL
jgi:adenosylhomocysteinase